MVQRCLSALVSIRSVKVTFSLFQSLCSLDDANRPISSAYISTSVACSALLFGPKMYLPKTYKSCKKRTCSMRINRVITVLPFPALISIGCNVKLMTRFHQDALPRIPCLAFMFVGIDNLRMRIYLHYRRCFPLPAIGVKLFIYKMFGGPYCTCCSIDHYHIKFQTNRTTNK